MDAQGHAFPSSHYRDHPLGLRREGILVRAGGIELCCDPGAQGRAQCSAGSAPHSAQHRRKQGNYDGRGPTCCIRQKRQQSKHCRITNKEGVNHPARPGQSNAESAHPDRRPGASRYHTSEECSRPPDERMQAGGKNGNDRDVRGGLHGVVMLSGAGITSGASRQNAGSAALLL